MSPSPVDASHELFKVCFCSSSLFLLLGFLHVVCARVVCSFKGVSLTISRIFSVPVQICLYLCFFFACMVYFEAKGVNKLVKVLVCVCVSSHCHVLLCVGISLHDCQV